jgi:hypothetical protein
MSAFAYPAKFSAGSDGRVPVEFSDLPRAATDGKDEREAMEEAMDAPYSSTVMARAEAGLYLAMRDQGLSNSELARRLLDPEHATKAEKIQAALGVLRKQMTVEVRGAAY